jgi:hypothetical protein
VRDTLAAAALMAASVIALYVFIVFPWLEHVGAALEGAL